MVEEVDAVNKVMKSEKRGYVLMAPGAGVRAMVFGRTREMDRYPRLQ